MIILMMMISRHEIISVQQGCYLINIDLLIIF